jgi:hypothetical protein
LKSLRHPVLPLLASLVLGATGCGAKSGIPDGARAVATLDGSAPGQGWYRGNLHAHSLWSDGDAYPEQVLAWYRDHGYQFAAISDHDQVLAGERWIDVANSRGGLPALEALRHQQPDAVVTREADGKTQARLAPFDELARRFDAPRRFLVLRGSELSDSAGSTSIHLTTLNVDGVMPPLRGASVAATVESHLAALARRPQAVGVLNHPNFTWSVTAEQMMRMPSLRLFELYNGHPLSNNPGDALHASTERAWDIVLTHRVAILGQPLLFATAADDAHQFTAGPLADSSAGRGWVMVSASRLAPDAIADALRNGRFYASTGVSLARVVEYDTGLRVEVSGEPGVDYTVDFIGTRRGAELRSRPARSRGGRLIYATRRYSDAVGQRLASIQGTVAEYAFHPDDLYVRARVTAARRHPNPSQPRQFEQAWVQPVLGPAGRVAVREDARALPPPSPVALHAALASSLQRVDADSPLPRTAPTPDCKLDLVGNARGVPNLVLTHDDAMMLGGWIADRRRPEAPLAVGVVLRDRDRYVAEVDNGVARVDVAAQLGHPGLERAGFNVVLPLGNVRQGTYAIELLAHYPTDTLACVTGFRVMVRPPPPRPNAG